MKKFPSYLGCMIGSLALTGLLNGSPPSTKWLDRLESDPEGTSREFLTNVYTDDQFVFPPLAEAVQDGLKHCEQLSQLSIEELALGAFHRMLINQILLVFRDILGLSSTIQVTDNGEPHGTLQVPYLPLSTCIKIRESIIDTVRRHSPTIVEFDPLALTSELQTTLEMSNYFDPEILTTFPLPNNILVKGYREKIPMTDGRTFAQLCQEIKARLPQELYREKAKSFKPNLKKWIKRLKQQQSIGGYASQYKTVTAYMTFVSSFFNNTKTPGRFDKYREYLRRYGAAVPILSRYPLALRHFNYMAGYPMYFAAISFDLPYDLATYIIFDSSWGEISGADFHFHDEQHFSAKLWVAEQALDHFEESDNSRKGVGTFPGKEIYQQWQQNLKDICKFVDSTADDEEVRLFCHAIKFDLSHECRWLLVQEAIPLLPEFWRFELIHTDEHGLTRSNKLQLAFLKGIYGPNLSKLLLDNYEPAFGERYYGIQCFPDHMPLCPKFEEAQSLLLAGISELKNPYLDLPQLTLKEYQNIWGQKAYDFEKASRIRKTLMEGRDLELLKHVPTAREWLDSHDISCQEHKASGPALALRLDEPD